MPPHAHLESVRIRQAQRLLAQGYPIAQIAAELGFSDQSHLTRRFTRLLGITPGHYLHSKIVQDTQAAHRVRGGARGAIVQAPLEFLVISQPNSRDDRVLLDALEEKRT